MTILAPTSADDLVGLLRDAADRREPIELRGGGSKAAIGAERDATIVDMRGFAGIVDYDPPELVLTARAGTPLDEIEALVEAQGQMLAFQPYRHAAIFGTDASATIGGVVAAGVAGSRRLTAGGARDHLLGFAAVSGRGESFVGGGKVVKNVTGYDLPKLIAGSWGRLVALTELTLKVLPRPRLVRTLAIEGLDVTRACAAMARAMGSPAEVGAAAHLAGKTLFRLEGFGPSVEARCALLPGLLADHGRALLLPEDEACALWAGVDSVSPLADAPVLWRINLPATAAPALIDRFEILGARWQLDWAGSLIWLAFDGDPALVRQAAEAASGHAMLVRAPAALRNAVPMQHPRPAPVARLEARVRRAFDPHGVFETGRFLDDSDAH